MAVMIASPELREFFLVITGDPFPAVNEDALLALAHKWGAWANDLELVILPELVLTVRKIRDGIFGNAEQAFADRLAPYVVEDPMYLPAAIEQFQQNRAILEELGLQAAIMKRALLVELIELFVEAAVVAALSWTTLGAMMSAYLARAAAFRFFAKTVTRRFITAVASAQFFGIGFQTAIVGLALEWAGKEYKEIP